MTNLPAADGGCTAVSVRAGQRERAGTQLSERAATDWSARFANRHVLSRRVKF